jgi:predicted transcriptional regulator
LNTEHGLTVGQYRSKYNLPSVYPMVAPEYARVRSAIAKDMGLGKTRGVAPERGVGKKV